MNISPSIKRGATRRPRGATGLRPGLFVARGAASGSFLPAATAAFVLVVGVAVGCGHGETGDAARADLTAAGAAPALAESLQALLDRLVAEEPGVRSAVLLVDGPDLHWAGASGIAFAESGRPILPADQFNIDSIAKMMTASVAMLLVEDGALALDERIAAHLPESLVEGLHVYEGRSYGEEITVRQILSHTSGIRDDWACPGFLDLVAEDPERRWRPEETVEYVKSNCPPLFPPGGGFHYSDTAYNVLGLVLENVTGKPLHELQREKLFAPLGMAHTYRPAYEPATPSLPGRPPVERYLDDLECALWPSVMTADWAGGGLVSTAQDLNRFMRAFVENRIFRDPSTKATMLTWVESGPHNNYGLGVSRVLFERFEDPAVAALGEVWGHSGSSHNFMYYWPRGDVTLVGTMNQMSVETDLYDIVATILQRIQASRQTDGAQ